MHDCCIRVIHSMVTALLEYLDLLTVFREAYVDLILFVTILVEYHHFCKQNRLSYSSQTPILKKDELDNLCHTLSNINSSQNSSCIHDFHRLGKFNPTSHKPRPLLAKFLRIYDATLLLPKGSSLPSPIVIKPDLT